MLLDFGSAFLQKFLEIVLPVLVSALAGLAIAWITKVVNQIKSSISSDAQWYISQAVESAVLAAEQVGLDDFLMDKKQYALNVAQKQLDAKGIKIDLGILSDLIEAAVMSEFNRGREPVFELGESEPE